MHTDIACDDVVAHSEYLVVVVFPPSAHMRNGISPDTPNRVSRGEYLHTHICMYGEIHHSALCTAHHDMHGSKNTCPCGCTEQVHGVVVLLPDNVLKYLPAAVRCASIATCWRIPATAAIDTSLAVAIMDTQTVYSYRTATRYSSP